MVKVALNELSDRKLSFSLGFSREFWVKLERFLTNFFFGFSNFHSNQFVQGSAEMLGEFSTDTDLQQGDNLVHSKL